MNCFEGMCLPYILCLVFLLTNMSLSAAGVIYSHIIETVRVICSLNILLSVVNGVIIVMVLVRSLKIQTEKQVKQRMGNC